MQPALRRPGTAFRLGPSTAPPVGNQAWAGTACRHRSCLGRLSSPHAGTAQHGLFNEARRRPEQAQPTPTQPGVYNRAGRAADGALTLIPTPPAAQPQPPLPRHSPLSTHLASPRSLVWADTVDLDSGDLHRPQPQDRCRLDAHDWLCWTPARRHVAVFFHDSGDRTSPSWAFSLQFASTSSLSSSPSHLPYLDPSDMWVCSLLTVLVCPLPLLTVVDSVSLSSLSLASVTTSYPAPSSGCVGTLKP